MNNNIIECIFEFYNFKNIIDSTLIIKPKNNNISLSSYFLIIIVLIFSSHFHLRNKNLHLRKML